MKNSALSVILPCYNAEKTLEETLESLATQTFTNFEVVAVDDGSTDSTGLILEKWRKRDARFTHISTSHGGVISASNLGMLECCAPYIARMDADDRTRPTRFEKQFTFLEENPDIAVVSCLVEAFPKKDVGGGFQVYIDWLNSLITEEEIKREIFDR